MSDETPEHADAEPVPDSKPRRKKKRRAEAEAAAPPVREPWTSVLKAPTAAPDARDARPAFARDFPRDPDLDALVSAFEAGDYGHVRREAPALAKSTDREDVRAAARELRKRLDPDPLAVYLLGIAAVLLVVLAGYYWLHPHAP